MSTENSPQANSAAATVAAVVDGAVDAAADAVAAANARAEAAEEVAALVSEAAVQRTITDDVNDLREEVEQCQNDLSETRTLLQTLQATLPTLVTMEILTAQIAELKALQLAPVLAPSIPTPPSETPLANHSPQNPESAGAGDRAEAAPGAHPPKSSRYHLT